MGIDITTIIAEAAARKAAEVQHRNAANAAYNRFDRAQRLGWDIERAMGMCPTPSAERMAVLASRYEAVSAATAAAKAAAKAASDAAFEESWQQRKAEKAATLAEKYSSVQEAFDGFCLSSDVALLAGVLYPHQQVVRIEKSGSDKADPTTGLPMWADLPEYSTVRHGTVYHFHPSTLKVGEVVEYEGSLWEVLVNHYSRGSGASLAYQCLWLVEVAQKLPE